MRRIVIVNCIVSFAFLLACYLVKTEFPGAGAELHFAERTSVRYVIGSLILVVIGFLEKGTDEKLRLRREMLFASVIDLFPLAIAIQISLGVFPGKIWPVVTVVLANLCGLGGFLAKKYFTLRKLGI